MGLRKLAFVLSAITLVVALAACNSLGESDEAGRSNSNQKRLSEFPHRATRRTRARGPKVPGPEDKTLALSVPDADINIDQILTERGDDTQALTDNAAVHLLYTGFPWEDEANVCFAGHVEGYERTPSYRPSKVSNGSKTEIRSS